MSLCSFCRKWGEAWWLWVFSPSPAQGIPTEIICILCNTSLSNKSLQPDKNKLDFPSPWTHFSFGRGNVDFSILLEFLQCFRGRDLCKSTLEVTARLRVPQRLAASAAWCLARFPWAPRCALLTRGYAWRPCRVQTYLTELLSCWRRGDSGASALL